MSKSLNNKNSVLFALNIVSLAAASLVLILFIIASIVKPNLVKRVTLRLQTGSAAADIILHINNLIEVNNDYCEAIGFFRYYTRLAYCLINISIALNLQLIFIHEREPNNKWEIIYWVVSIFLALVLNIPQICLNSYKREDGVRCILNPASPGGYAMGMLFSSILISTFIYCLIVSILVLLRLRKDWTSLVKSTFNQMGQTRKRMKWLQRELKRLALRVLLYPVVTFIVLSGFAISQFASDDSKGLLQSWSIIGQDLSGLLDFVAICFDPSLQYCYLTIFKDLRDRFFKRTLITEPPNTNRNSQQAEANDIEATYFSDNEFTINSETPSEESYQCIMFDDDQCRQAVEMF